jgi:DNA polymerase-3 subunit beta
MQFIAQRNDLLSALTTAGKAIGKSVIPILDNFRFQIQGNECTVTGSNMDVFIVTKLDVQSDIEELQFCLHRDKMLNLLKAMPDQPVNFKVKITEGKLISDEWVIKVIVSYSSGKCEFTAEDCRSYPLIPEVSGQEINISGNKLVEGLDKVLFAIDPNTAAGNHFKNCLFDFGDGINVVGCNVLQMSVQRIYDDTINRHQALISKAAIEMIRSINCADQVVISYSDKNLMFKMSDNIYITARVVDGKYPKYHAAIPDEDLNKAVLDIEELTGAIKRVSLFATKVDSSAYIHFKFSDDKLSLSAENIDYEESAGEVVSCEYKGDNFEILLVASFVLNMLSKIKGEAAHIGLTSHKHPAVIRGSESKEKFDLFLAMPMVMPNR